MFQKKKRWPLKMWTDYNKIKKSWPTWKNLISFMRDNKKTFHCFFVNITQNNINSKKERSEVVVENVVKQN